MRVPYSVQGALFAPTLMGLVFVLQVTCPEPVGGGCFADNFTIPLFMPAVFLNSVLSGAGAFGQYELLFIMLYWVLVGALFGFIFDLYRDQSQY